MSLQGSFRDHPHRDLLISLQSLQGYYQTVAEHLVRANAQGDGAGTFIADCHWHHWTGSGRGNQNPMEPSEDGNTCDKTTLFYFINPEYSVCYTFHTQDSERVLDHSVRGLTTRLYLDDFKEVVIPTIDMVSTVGNTRH